MNNKRLTKKEYIQINQALFFIINKYEKKRKKFDKENKTGLRLADRAVCTILGKHGKMNSRELSRLMDINPGTISVYVHRLESKGIIVKDQDKYDRRNWELYLTSKGKEIYEDTVSGIVEYTSQFLDILTKEEQKVIHKLLLKVSDNIGFTLQ